MMLKVMQFEKNISLFGEFYKNYLYSQKRPNSHLIINLIILFMEEIKKKNGIGTAGFILALIGLVFCWVPILDWILWFLGILFSFIGVFKQPRGLSIAGLVISCIGIIIIIAAIGAVAGAAAMF